MKKEQICINVLPITRIALERERQAKGLKSSSEHINLILEAHITKANKEENFKSLLDEKVKDLEEKNRQLEEKITTNFNLVNKLLTRIIGSVEK
ncbi:hypothetical protein [Burkholderia vietnamiensis]|uniref:hypothetical protein n=1 Tax=Burkholderia vietnamiensis TaxID=60552 RepID=UPI001594BE64|nr:hypothetical protein [Burkholderia vietnamiensis]